MHHQVWSNTSECQGCLYDLIISYLSSSGLHPYNMIVLFCSSKKDLCNAITTMDHCPNGTIISVSIAKHHDLAAGFWRNIHTFLYYNVNYSFSPSPIEIHIVPIWLLWKFVIICLSNFIAFLSPKYYFIIGYFFIKVGGHL